VNGAAPVSAGILGVLQAELPSRWMRFHDAAGPAVESNTCPAAGDTPLI
jgi:hypothetical protein